MKISFSLGWARPGPLTRKNFKLEAAESLFREYVERISKFSDCHIVGSISLNSARSSGIKLWLCEPSKHATSLSSNQLADRLSTLLDTNCKELRIAIGGPDGFSEEEIRQLKPDLRWSFGPLTLPHELAAIVASEQIYRAWATLRHLPYHTGH